MADNIDITEHHETLSDINSRIQAFADRYYSFGKKHGKEQAEKRIVKDLEAMAEEIVPTRKSDEGIPYTKAIPLEAIRKYFKVEEEK